jgi:dinuclear metal center YbgI/SA1388 family protein
MRVNARKLIQRLEALYPPYLADEWDNVGFQIGNEHHVVERILICLEVTETVIDEAVEKSIDLIIAHHPLIFKAPKTLSESNPKARLITRLIRESISLYVMHTNFDHAEGGLNDILAQLLGLDRLAPIKTVYEEKLYKLAVYVPSAHLDAVAEGIYAAGAGKIGKYDSCGFEINGMGTFRPLEGATPFSGEVGKISRESEVKLETVVPETVLSGVLEAMRKHHPYETIAYDVFMLKTPARTFSLGRVGYLPEPMAFEDFTTMIKAKLNLSFVRLAFPKEKKVNKIALITGAGMSFIGDVAKTSADVFLTGDLRYHEVLEHKHLGMSLVDVGHFESEVIYAPALKSVLDEIIKDQEYDVVVSVSDSERPIFEIY